jgi:hypothetical protein
MVYFDGLAFEKGLSIFGQTINVQNYTNFSYEHSSL